MKYTIKYKVTGKEIEKIFIAYCKIFNVEKHEDMLIDLSTLIPPSYFKKNLSNMNITLYNY